MSEFDQDAQAPTDAMAVESPQRRLSDRLNPHDAGGSCKALDEVQLRLSGGDERMNRIEKKLDDNSSDTAEVLDILRLGKSFFRLAGYFGSFVKWVSAIGAAVLAFWYALKSGGKH